MNRRTIGTITLTPAWPFRGAATADFAYWVAARWGIAQRPRVGRAPSVFRKRQGVWGVVERHIQTGWQSGAGAVHAHFRLGLNLQFTQYVIGRAAAVDFASTASLTTHRSMVQRNVFRADQSPIWRTLQSWTRLLGQDRLLHGGTPVAANGAHVRATASSPRWSGSDNPAAQYFATHTSRNDSWQWRKLVNQYTTMAGGNRMALVSVPATDGADAPLPSVTALTSWLLAKSENNTWLQVPVAHRTESRNSAGAPSRSDAISMTAVRNGGSRASSEPAEYRRTVAPIDLAHAKPARAGEPDVAQSLMQIQQTLSAIKPREAAPQPVDIPHLTRQVYDQFERELRIEKERRGL